MHLYKTAKGNVLKYNGKSFLVNGSWDTLINQQNLYSHLVHSIISAQIIPDEKSDDYIANHILPPIGSQEVWAAGVTYLRSRDARMEESKESGSADVYQKVYEAERPELFFKSLPHRVT